MRALNKSWIGIALVILFGASLFFFRGSSRYSNLFNSDNFVANVSGTQISTTQFLRALELNIGQFAQMIGEELTGDQIRAFQIHQLVLQNLVNNAIFESEFDNLDYILDDSIIAKKTKERFPSLYVNNKINDDALNNFLKQQRLKIEDLVNIIDYETRSVLFDNLFFEKNYPSEFSKKINMHNNQTRNVDLITIPYQNIIIPNLNLKNITIDDSDLINYFKENSNKYMTKETRDLSYIILDKVSYEDKFTPSQNEILEYFNDNKGLYLIPEKRSFQQFNFKSKEEAESFKLEITGLSNNEIITLASDKDIKFNNFEDVDKNQVLEELSTVIFSLNKDEISEIVKTTLAYHIIILENIVIEIEPSLEDVAEIIKDTLTNVQLDNFFNDLKLKINQQILNGLSISEIAEDNNLSVNFLNKINIDTENENNIKKAVINYAFTQNKDFISDVNDYNTNQSFIINVDAIYPSETENLNTVFDIVLDDFIKSKKLIFINDVYEKNKNNSDLEKINSIFNMNIERVDLKFDSDNLPKSMTQNIFNTDLNNITFSSDLNNIYFARVNKISMANKIDTLQDISLISELKNAFGNEIIKTKNISLNDELINGLLSQYK